MSVQLDVVPSRAAFGGGTSPEKLFESRALALRHPEISADGLAAALRAATPPIVARLEDGTALLDLRSIAPEEDAAVAEALGSYSEARAEPADADAIIDP